MMNYLAVFANFMSTSTVVSLILLMLALMYLHKTLTHYKGVDPTLVGVWITPKIMKIFKMFNYGIFSFLIIFSLFKVVVAADINQKEETRKNIAAHKEALIIKNEKPKLDRDVFFLCLDAAKTKEGVPVESIKACENVALHESQPTTNSRAGYL